MEHLDKDLQSIQEVRNLISAARSAQKVLASFSQEQIDKIAAAIAKAGEEHAPELAEMAHDETGFGIIQDKVIKNRFASQYVYDSLKNVKTVGIINEDTEQKVVEIAVPMGIVAGIIPSTNPTSTVIYKALIAVKSGNAIIISPHPGAKRCILRTVNVVRAAAEAAGCPKGVIGCIELPTLESTNELMKRADIILATGGSAMVKSAYSSGTPAIGVGPGNGPAFIEKTADIKLAVKRILDSKTFDQGTICASEQSIVTEESIKEKVKDELVSQGAYFLNENEKGKIASVLMRSNGTMNPGIVGKSPQYIADLAGIKVPDKIRVLIGNEDSVGSKAPFSREKLCPVLAFYVERDWQSACDRCIEILENEGVGHTMIIHSNDESIIREFALKKPVSRILVNTPGALGGIGATTNLLPALTLGCGTVGGSSTSDNIGPLNLINIRRIGYGIREREDIESSADGDSNAMADSVSDSDEIINAVLSRVMEKMKGKLQ
ncbi:MAG: acetaldehyde dehydrogenase (acetylating) [Lachnospiraceae bacterium]